MSDREHELAVHPIPRWVGRLARAQRPTAFEDLAAHDDIAPSPDGVTDTVVVAASPRTGSNLLVHTLRELGVGAGEEFWTERMIWAGRARWGVPTIDTRGVLGQTKRALLRRERWWLSRSFDADQFLRYQRLLEQHRSTPDGVFVIKVFRLHLDQLERRNQLSPIDVLPGRLHWVYQWRRDRVGQAISYLRADATASWIDTDGTRTPTFDPDRLVDDDYAELRRLVERFDRSDSWWRAWFDRHGVTPLEFEYEQLVGDLRSAVARVFESLGRPVPDDVVGATVRQRDDANDEIRTRLLDRYPELDR
ncbi:LPS sulfotransferase NodH [Ilumatobacter fluminis]|uniref:LPS sulfotransferase NodH n=1 Tax=Ilumatobacter fluminis TaxID=467091 RepID=A0A4R7HZM2_9ACTN|nr:Stf0 family sulfotransferase [Ilumatobacter fluminis]TDT15623.1 LPS sulfotransferase NodH [Ilumatobacter fluminis]